MFALGCSDRPLSDTESAPSTSQTAGETESGTAPDPTGTPTTTSGPDGTTGPVVTTVPVTSGPDVTSEAMTGTSAPATSGVAIDLGTSSVCGDGVCSLDEECFCLDDCPSCQLPAGLVGCPAAWSGGSKVTGSTAFGEFTGETAFFGWNGIGDARWSDLQLFIYDGSVDLDAAKANPWSSEWSALQLFTSWSQPQWVNKDTVQGVVTRMGESADVLAVLAVTGTAGNWQRMDPNDPPRLLGMIEDLPGDPLVLSGPFDAVFCDAFVTQVFPE